MMRENAMDDEVDRLFAAARQLDSVPSQGLIDRVLADAAALQPRAAGGRISVTPQRRAPILERIWLGLTAGIAGGPVLASLGVLALAAVFAGYTASAGVSEAFLDTSESGAGALELVPVAEYFLFEG